MRVAGRIVLCLMALLCSTFAAPVGAHLLAPALLELTQTAPSEYAVHWRVTVLGTQRQSLRPRLPETCTDTTPVQVAPRQGSALDLAWTVRCAPAELTGQTLAVEGLAGSGVNVIVRVTATQRAPFKALLDEAHPALTIGGPATAAAVFRSYLQFGVEHLLGGFDHLLFLLGLLLLVRSLRMLIATITAFTLGHSVTLALAALGLVRLPQPLAELAIAVTIVILAVQLAAPAAAGRGVFQRRPWLMASAFGLLHGLGFAGALSGIGLPADELPLALLAFNLGIEAGQLLAVVAALAVGMLWLRLRPHLPPPLVMTAQALPAYAIGSLAALWCLERAAMVLAG